jgi:DNA-binding transcriptional MerR regulator
MDDTDEWMSSDGAAATLRRSARQIRVYASRGQIRSRRRGPGGRVEYHAGDVYALAAELQSERDLPRADVVEIVPSSQLAAQLERLQAELRDTLARAERAETALRLLPGAEDAHAWRAERDAAQAEARALREMLASARGTGAAWGRVALLALVIALVAVAAVVVLALVR